MKNTVTIDLVEYNELRDFKKAIKEGKKLVVTMNNVLGFSIEEEVYTDSEIAKTYIEEIKKLQKLIKKKDEEIEGMIGKYSETHPNWFQRIFCRKRDVVSGNRNYKINIEKIQ